MYNQSFNNYSFPLNNATVGDIIAVLSTLPAGMPFSFCHQAAGFINVSEYACGLDRDAAYHTNAVMMIDRLHGQAYYLREQFDRNDEPTGSIAILYKAGCPAMLLTDEEIEAAFGPEGSIDLSAPEWETVSADEFFTDWCEGLRFTYDNIIKPLSAAS